MAVFARHGFHNVAERINLGKFIIERLNSNSEIEKYTIAERIRMSFEELGPTFVKFGQLLATRPDLVPMSFITEFEKLQDQVQQVPFEIIEQVLKDEFGNQLYHHFTHIDSIPLGSASIAQVHKATLKDGSSVVIKVQRPGIIQTINDDLNVLYFLAELLETYIPETKLYNPIGIVDEYFKTLELETNFVVEANNIRRFQENFKNEDRIKIPQVYMDLTTERVLVMEALEGTPLSQEGSLNANINRDEVLRIALRAYLKMVFVDGLFHGDLHAGNFFILPDNKIGLIDFGVVGRLNNKTQNAIANMLIALSQEDYERLAYEYVDLAPFSEHVDIDVFAKELRSLIAPYYGLSLKSVNFGKILLNSSSVATKHKLQLPTDLMLYFKSIVAIEGLARKISIQFDFLSYSLEFAKELVKHHYDPTKMTAELYQVARESKSFLQGLPRQLNFMMRKMNSPNYAHKHNINGLDQFRKSMVASFNLMFLGIIIASLIIGSSLVYVHDTGPHIGALPALSFIGFALALIMGVVSFFNYLTKK